MGDEDVTQTTRYVRALEAVAEAARRVEEVRVRYENTVDALAREKRAADEALRVALAYAMELTGQSLPVSEQDKARAETREALARLQQSNSGKGTKK